MMVGFLRWSMLGVLLAILVFAAPGGAAPPCAMASPDEAKALAERAARLLEEVGPEKALPAFMDAEGDFIDRDLYVFVLDLNGMLWASGAFPQSIGRDARLARDSKGRLYIQEMIRLAIERGEGWVAYEWINPCTGEISPKVSFIKRVGPFIVGAGAYGTISTGLAGRTA